jgi:tetratricopeptide (TPR) repeat protein
LNCLKLQKKHPSGTAETLPDSWNRAWLMGLLLVGVTFLVYLPAILGQFVWDDDSWTGKLIGMLRNVSGLRLIWCQLTALQQYYPLTATTFWLDYHLWGFWPLPYHVENVLLHILAALLFWRLLERLGVAGAWLAAAIFALHPVMVESAGWITERKNVLSLVCYLGSLLAYGRFNAFWQGDAAPERKAPGCWGYYTMAWFLFLGALLAKTTAFSLPAVVLLIAWWKGGRLRWRTEVLPAIPFFVLSFSLCLVTAWLEKNHVMAQGPDFSQTLPERCLIAGRVPWFYLGHLLWPAGLCFNYPRWPLNAGSWQQWLYPVTAVGALLALWLARKRIGRGPATAAFFFVGTLLPVLGFMNAYGMRYSYVWDHWVYLSSLGLITLVAALVARAAQQLRVPVMLHGFAAIVLPVLAVLTWRQCGTYADMETLWRATIATNPDAWLAHDNLGNILSQDGRLDEAMDQFQKTLAIQPDDLLARNNLGLILCQKGRVDEAIAQFQKGLATQPDSALILNNLGKALLTKGQPREAMIQFRKILEKNPGDLMAHYNLGTAFFQNGQVDEAIGHFQKALEIQPDFARAHNKLGVVLLRRGLADEAIAHFQRALEIRSDFADAGYNLNHAVWRLATSPEASLRNGPRALALAQQLDRLSGGNNPVLLDTLAAARAENGQFPEAIDAAQRALALAQNDATLADTLRQHIKSFQAGSPLRCASETNAGPDLTPP